MNTLTKTIMAGLLLGPTARATNAHLLVASCPEELESPKASTVDISDEYSTVAHTSQFANHLIGVVLTVSEDKRETVLDNLRALLISLGRTRGDLSFRSRTLVVGHESLVHVHLYGRDLIYVARYLRSVQAIDLELEEKHELGLTDHLPNRENDPRLLKFNRRLFDPLMRLPNSEFQVLVGVAHRNHTDVARLAHELSRSFTVVHSNIADQFVEIRGKGSDILGLKDWPEVMTVEAQHNGSH